jgi:hypothetical protein
MVPAFEPVIVPALDPVIVPALDPVIVPAFEPVMVPAFEPVMVPAEAAELIVRVRIAANSVGLRPFIFFLLVNSTVYWVKPAGYGLLLWRCGPCSANFANIVLRMCLLQALCQTLPRHSRRM